MNRAEIISQDFAKQFQAKLAEKRSTASRLPLVAQADFAYLFKVATRSPGSQQEVQVEEVREMEVLRGLKDTIKCYIKV